MTVDGELCSTIDSFHRSGARVYPCQLLPHTSPHLAVNGAVSRFAQGCTHSCLTYFSHPFHPFHVCHPFVDFIFLIDSFSLLLSNMSPMSIFNLHAMSVLITLFHFIFSLSLSHTLFYSLVCFCFWMLDILFFLSSSILSIFQIS